MRLVFIPPVPLNAFPYTRFTMSITRIDIEKLKEIVSMARERNLEIKCYIRHPSTVKVLNEALGLNLEPSTELYRHQQGDIIIVVGLKKPVRGQEVQVTIDDLDLAYVVIEERR